MATLGDGASFNFSVVPGLDQRAVDKVKASIDKMVQSRSIDVQLDAAKLNTQLAKVNADVAKATGDRTLKVQANTDLATAKLEELSLKADKAASDRTLDINVKTDDSWISKLKQQFGMGGQEADAAFNDSLKGGGGGGGVAFMSPEVLGPLAAVGLAVLPGAFAAAGAAGAAALGVALAVKGSPALQKAATGLLSDLETTMEGAASVLDKPIAGAISAIGSQLPEIGKLFSQTFGDVAPLIKPMTTMLTDLVENTMPGFNSLMKQAQGPLASFFDTAGKIVGTGLGNFFASLGPGVKPSLGIVLSLLQTLSNLLPVIGTLSSLMAKLLLPSFQEVASASLALERAVSGVSTGFSDITKEASPAYDALMKYVSGGQMSASSSNKAASEAGKFGEKLLGLVTNPVGAFLSVFNKGANDSANAQAAAAAATAANTKRIDDQRSALINNIAALGKAGGADTSLAAALQTVTGKVNAQVAAVDSVDSSWQKFFGLMGSTQSALSTVQTDISNATDALKKYGSGSLQANAAIGQMIADNETLVSDLKSQAAAAGNNSTALATMRAAFLDAARSQLTTAGSSKTLQGALVLQAQQAGINVNSWAQLKSMLDKGTGGLTAASGASDKLSQAQENNTLAAAKNQAAQTLLTKTLAQAQQQGELNTRQNAALSSAIQNNTGDIDTSKAAFEKFASQLGITQQSAANLWAKLKEAPTVKATVQVGVQTAGEAMASATINGKATQIAALSYHNGAVSFNGYAYASGGKLPGFSNKDNMLASSPMGPVALAGGEAIVPNYLANHPEFTDFASKHGIPGFTSGGIVSGDVTGSSALGQVPGGVNAYAQSLSNPNLGFGGKVNSGFALGLNNAVLQAYAGQGGSVSGRAILADAETFKGHPYVWGGPSNPSQGWDCSSFVGYILGHDFNLPLPGGAKWNGNVHGPVAAQYNNEPGFHLVSHNTSDIQAGDLLVENSGGHVGFGVGPNQMFSAYGTAYGTIFSDAQNMTNIYRDGAAGGTVQALLSNSGFVNQVSQSVTKAVAGSPVLSALFPKLGGQYSGDPGATAGSADANGAAIYKYLMSALGMTKIAAAGAIASMYGESGWNPESVGTGGGGIYGATPLPPGMVTGNATKDLNTQLVDLVNFVHSSNDDSVIAEMNKATSVAAAAQLWDTGVERAGVSDVHSTGITLATQIAGLATGGKVPTTQQQITADTKIEATLKAEAAKALKSGTAKNYVHYEQQAADYARTIAGLNAKLHPAAPVPTLSLPKPTNQVEKVAEALMSNPYVSKYTSGANSTSPLGWALQPQLSNLMIGEVFNPSQWLGKASNVQLASVQANWTAAMESLGGWMNSDPGYNALKLAGNMLSIHGVQTEGSKKSFQLGGTVPEKVVGTGVSSGADYTFHAGDRLVGPNVTAGQVDNGTDQETKALLRQNNSLLSSLVNVAAQAPNQYARALNQNAGRRVH